MVIDHNLGYKRVSDKEEEVILNLFSWYKRDSMKNEFAAVNFLDKNQRKNLNI